MFIVYVMYHLYPVHACAKGLSNRFCPSVSPVKNFEISTFTGLTIAVRGNDMVI